MTTQTPPNFKDFIFKEFVEWEKKQPNHRSSFSAFARWLSDNRYELVLKQQLISDWVKGRYAPKEEMFILVLAEKLGNQVYEVLNVDPIDPLRIYVLRNWKKAPQKVKVELAKTISKHTTEPLPDEATENSSSKSK
jgi:hypothetical protein